MQDILRPEELSIRRIKASARNTLRSDVRQLTQTGNALKSFLQNNHSVFRPGWALGNKTILPRLPLLQRSSVIVRYSSNKLPGSWKAHGIYLMREHAQQLGAQGMGFNQDSSTISIDKLLDTWQEAGDMRLWKIIVSPEFGDKLDLKIHTRQLVHDMENTLNTALEWVAIDHYNTDNPHVHLLIRGKRKNGQPLLLDREYINEGIRTHSRIVATRQLGHRTQHHMSLARERQISSERFTQLDKEILGKSVPTPEGYRFTLQPAPAIDQGAYNARMQLIKRLKKLEAMQLASYSGKLSWHITSNCKINLQNRGVIAAQMKILDRHRHLLTDPSQKLVRTELKQAGERVTGIILGSGIDPETDNPYLLLEAIDGKAHFLQQSAKIQELRLQEHVKDGSVISIDVKSFRDNATGKTVLYQHIGHHGNVTAALQNKLLLDNEIIYKIIHAKLSLLPLNNGFAKKFHNALQARESLLEKEGLITRGNNNLHFTNQWAERYPQLRMHEMREALQISAPIAAWNAKHMLIGKVMHSDTMFTVLHAIDGSHHYFATPEQEFVQLTAGMEVIAEPRLKNGSTGIFITEIDHSKLAAPDTKLTTLDQMLVLFSGNSSTESPLPELAALLTKQAALWKSRNIDPAAPFYLQKAKSWYEKNLTQPLER